MKDYSGDKKELAYSIDVAKLIDDALERDNQQFENVNEWFLMSEHLKTIVTDVQLRHVYSPKLNEAGYGYNNLFIVTTPKLTFAISSSARLHMVADNISWKDSLAVYLSNSPKMINAHYTPKT